MSTREIRQKLFDYIRMADDKKVKAFYTIIESEIQQEKEIWTDQFLETLNKRTLEFESGKEKGHTWNEVKAQAKKLTRAKT